jgi:hypothetical protein
MKTLLVQRSLTQKSFPGAHVNFLKIKLRFFQEDLLKKLTRMKQNGKKYSKSIHQNKYLNQLKLPPSVKSLKKLEF